MNTKPKPLIMHSVSTPSVTVLMPAYNAGMYLRMAIDSILAQTFSDFELLIINDGSTDDTAQILATYTDARLRIIHQQNRGLIDTLNTGIAEARADLIARMDADDVALPERLQMQVAYMDSHKDCVLLGAQANVIDKDGVFVYKLEPPGYTHDEIAAVVADVCPFIHPGVMFRKAAVLQAGGYPKNALTFEDHLLWKKMIAVGRVHNLHQVLVNYRFNPGSVTIDEKWRGPRFQAIRRNAVAAGFVTNEEAAELKDIIASQNFDAYKRAAYHATLGKKYLWTNPDGAKARYNLMQVIKQYPRNKEALLLYVLAWLPSFVRVGIYKALKRS